MNEKRQRADQLLVSQQLAGSRAQAARLIKAGLVSVAQGGLWLAVEKPSQPLAGDAVLRVAENEASRFVSRGALKLAHALQSAQVEVTGLTALDVGQSTGGFTDCLLQAGAVHVVGVDVGHDQLAAKLRADPRVTCLEGINARQLPAASLLELCPGGYDLIVMDVSFISQTLILPNLPALLRPGGYLISLVKPQFEVGREHVGKGGLVRDAALYPQLQAKIETLVVELGLAVRFFLPSPITGGDGNREFLLLAQKPSGAGG